MTTNNIPADVSAAVARIDDVAAYLNSKFYERADVIDVINTSLVAGEHACLIGEPGIAKSAVFNEVVRLLLLSTPGHGHFTYLLTRFTEPNEVFGPVNVPRFKTDGVYERNTARMLPSATTAFMDEAFKANSAILNAMLTLMNERKFDNGGQRLNAPLRTMFIASNELPQEQNLTALWDRCLLRVHVKPIESDDNFAALLFADEVATPEPTITMKDYETLGEYAKTLKFSAKAQAAIMGIANKLEDKKVNVGDRRWKKAAREVVRAYAALKGASEVGEEHLDILRFCLWEKLEQIPTIEAVIEEYSAVWLIAAREFTAKLDAAGARVNNARQATGATRLRALADLVELIEPMAGEAQALHKQYNRKETAALLARAEALTADAVNMARGR